MAEGRVELDRPRNGHVEVRADQPVIAIEVVTAVHAEVRALGHGVGNAGGTEEQHERNENASHDVRSSGLSARPLPGDRPRVRGFPPRAPWSGEPYHTFTTSGYPAKQHAHPFSCARATASTPDGTTCTPGSNAATHSAFTAAPSIRIFCATLPLYTVSATLQQPTCAPLASKASVPVPGRGSGSCFAKMLRTAKASPSLIPNTSPSLYFAQTASCMAIGIAAWRSTMTAESSASLLP